MVRRINSNPALSRGVPQRPSSRPLPQKIERKVPQITENIDQLSPEEILGMDAIVDSIVTGGMGSRMANGQYLRSAVKDAYEYYPQRKAQLDQLGVDENQLDGLGELTQGNRVVPMPIRQRLENGNELRTHVDYDVNPVTEQLEIVPYLDPSRPNEVLRTEFGYVDRLPGGHDKALEYLGENILKLTGRDASVNNKTLVNGRKQVQRADLVDNVSGENIDVELRETRAGDRYSRAVFPQQIDTNVYPMEKTYNGPYASRDLNNDVEAMIIKKARELNLSIPDAVDALVKDNQLGPYNKSSRMGKGRKAFIENVNHPDDVMDKILMPTFNTEQSSIGKQRGTDNEKRLVMPPQAVQMIDPKLAMEYADTVKGSKIKGSNFRQGPLRSRPSEGDVSSKGRPGHKRARVYIDIPNDATVRGQQIAENLISENPMVQQILARGFKQLEP